MTQSFLKSISLENSWLLQGNLLIITSNLLLIIIIFLVLVGSFLVSYIRARSEGQGLECKVGWFTRAERIIVIALGLLLNQVGIAMWILLVFIYVTVLQRLLYIRKQARMGGV